MSYEAPFEGVRVVDVSQGVAGPYAAMLLAQYGADVIKVEPPDGDWSRSLGVRYGDHTVWSIAANLGKRSIVLDLKRGEGLQILEKLVGSATVFIESFRPGVAARLGIDSARISAINPGILYLSISGFGQAGPERERPAMDPILQSFTGMVASNRGLDGVPHRVVPVVVDMSTGLYAFQTLSVALYARRHEPRGRYMETSLMQAATGLQSIHMLAYHLEGGQMRPGLVPGGSYQTRDGWMYFIVQRDAEFPALCRALDISDVGNDPRFATNAGRYERLDTLVAILKDAFARIETDTIATRLRDAGIMHSRVNDYLGFLQEPQVQATGVIAWIDHPGAGKIPVPNVPGRPPFESGSRLAIAPSLDQHRQEILAEIGHAR